MKANELRIGNWITGDNGPMQIEPNSFQNVFNGEYDQEPVPITEEWLLKFGFKKVSEANEIPSYENMIKIDCVPEMSCYWLDADIQTLPVKNVHQLQNLYFALVGEELTIK